MSTRFALLSFAASALLACSSSSNKTTSDAASDATTTPATDAASEAPPPCVPFDAGPAIPQPSDAGDAGDVGADAAATEAGPAIDAGAPAAPSDVQAVIERACAFSSCHGGSGGAGSVYLPKNSVDPATPPKWWTNLVGQRSAEYTKMNLVQPGDPTNSWLIQKLEGAQCGFDSACVGGSCGESMPRSNDLLSVDERDLFIRWIRQGAKSP